MFILGPIVAAAVLVFFGYASLWSAYQGSVPKVVSQCGKMVSIGLFVIAGLVIFLGVALRPCGGPGMKGRMQCGVAAFMQAPQQLPCPGQTMNAAPPAGGGAADEHPGR